MKKLIWDFWASRYDKLWVQKKSLAPTRKYVLNLIENECAKGAKTLLDLGCGPGELIQQVRERLSSLDITGIDFSKGMIALSEGKNPSVRHILMDVEELDKVDEKFDLVSCTHSFPYYVNKEKTISNLKGIIEPNGKLIMAFASGNSLYDIMVLFFVKLTTGPASYPSDKKFREMIKGNFIAESRHIVKESFYMPTIAVYTLRRQG